MTFPDAAPAGLTDAVVAVNRECARHLYRER
jgi:hypothetical protein